MCSLAFFAVFLPNKVFILPGILSERGFYCIVERICICRLTHSPRLSPAGYFDMHGIRRRDKRGMEFARNAMPV